MTKPAILFSSPFCFVIYFLLIFTELGTRTIAPPRIGVPLSTFVIIGEKELKFTWSAHNFLAGDPEVLVTKGAYFY